MALDISQLKYTVLSVQIANRSKASACAIILRHKIGEKIIFQNEFLINPETDNFYFSDYHGITYRSVKDKPTLRELWPKIQPYIEGQNIVLYWKEKTFSYLVKSLAKYHINPPDCKIIDVKDLFRSDREDLSYKSLARSVGFYDFEREYFTDIIELLDRCFIKSAKAGRKIIKETFGVKTIKPIKKEAPASSNDTYDNTATPISSLEKSEENMVIRNKWYYQKWFMWSMVILFWPLGIYLLYRCRKEGIKSKIK